jgi:superfamily II DNA/RNA helicase
MQKTAATAASAPAGRAVQQQRATMPLALILCPTRELAQQVAADAIGLMRGIQPLPRGLRIGTVVGGVPFGKQLFDLRNATLIVATPGRLLDLTQRGQVKLDHVEVLVLDEADRMLDLGFAEDVEAIHTQCDQRQQTLMFSATFAPRIMRLAEQVMRDPSRLELNTAQDKHADITQTLHWADNFTHKKKLLDHWLRDAALDQAVVFASTQADTELLAEELMQEGHSAVALHGAMPQSVRNRRLQNLRDGHIRILVATDVAARGIDVPTISHVFNFGLPMKAEDYVHRIGRTGRAGRSGTAVTIAEYRDRAKIRAIEQYTRQQLSATVIEGLEPTPPKPSHKKPVRGKSSGSGFKPGGGGGRSSYGGGGSGGPGHGRIVAAPAWGERREGGGGPASAKTSRGGRRSESAQSNSQRRASVR